MTPPLMPRRSHQPPEWNSPSFSYPLDVYWSSLDSGDLWYKSRHSKKELLHSEGWWLRGGTAASRRLSLAVHRSGWLTIHRLAR